MKPSKIIMLVDTLRANERFVNLDPCQMSGARDCERE